VTHELQTIEDAALAALAGIDGVRTLEVWSGQIDEKDLAALISRLPAVLPFCDEIKAEPRNQVDVLTAELTAIVADRDLRGPGDGSRGVFPILAAVREKLNGLKVIDGWAGLFPPHTRGSTHREGRGHDVRYVSPAHAGIDPGRQR
jgi:hypothetical protein